MFTQRKLSDEAAGKSYDYRKAEKAALISENVYGSLKLQAAKNPPLKPILEKAWLDVSEKIGAHYAAMIPTTKRDRDRGYGPKNYDVHLAQEVARECFLLATHRQLQSTQSVDTEAAATFTLTRIGVIGDQEAFFLSDGKMPETA